jgi:hypothetical protein
LGRSTNTQCTHTIMLQKLVAALQTAFNTNANGHVNYRTEISPPATLNTTTYSTNANCGYVLMLLKLQLWAAQREIFIAGYPSFPNLNLANELSTWLQYHFALTCRMYVNIPSKLLDAHHRTSKGEFFFLSITHLKACIHYVFLTHLKACLHYVFLS